MDNFDLKKYLAEGKLKEPIRESLNENSREVKVTEAQKRQMLKIAQDLENIVEIHDGVEGTRLLNARMQDRDVLIKAARVLKKLVKF